MKESATNTAGRMLAVLHPAIALTGIMQAINGPLLPSLDRVFHLPDNESGLLFLFFFAGTALGALLCRTNYARTITAGFLALTAGCLGVAFASRLLLHLDFLFLGIGVGVPVSAISLFVGRTFAARCAPTLTFLNFTWSAGAMAAPLLAAHLLRHHTYRAAYFVLATAAALATLACWRFLKDAPEIPRSTPATQGLNNLRLIAIFAFIGFLEVGVENTCSAWLSTYALRSAGSSVVLAAASSSLFWGGFLVSRGFSSLVLLRVKPMRVLRFAVVEALAAAVVLVAFPGAIYRSAAMFLLGAALAPIYPLLLATFFSRARQTSDLRWVLAFSGFGGSVLPWLTGWISARSGSLQLGLITLPVTLLLMVCVMPALTGAGSRQQQPALAGK